MGLYTSSLTSDDEKKIALLEEGGYGNVYRRVYPRVLKKMAWLEQRGIEFHDLTYLYKNVEQPLYVDNCCHVNSLGYNMMVEKIVETIHQSNLAADANTHEGR